MILDFDKKLQFFEGEIAMLSCNLDKVVVRDAVWTEEKIWCCINDFNSLLSIDINTKKIELAGVFPNESYGGTQLYAAMKKIGNKIYCIPFFAKAIAVYDIQKKEFNNIEIDNSIFKCKSRGCYFWGVQEYKNYLFIFPFYGSAIIRLNINTNEIIYLSDWIAEIDSEVFNREEGYFKRQAILNDGKIYIPFCNANAVFEIECETLVWKIYKLGDEKVGYSGICYDGESFWLSPRVFGCIKKWNKKNNTIKNIVLEQNVSEIMEKEYIGIVFCKNNITVFPSEKNAVNLKYKEDVIVEQGIFSFVKEDKEYIVYFDSSTGILTMYNKVIDCVLEINVKVDDTILDIEKMIKVKGSVIESDIINLKKFFETITK